MRDDGSCPLGLRCPRCHPTEMARSRTTRRRPRRTRAKKSARRGSTYRKRTPYRRNAYAKRISRKAILNISATKKRNTMLAFSNTSSTGAISAVSQSPAYVPGNTTGKFLFVVTAQDLTDFNGNPTLRVNQAARTATTCYMRGFSEHLRIQTSSGLPWFHRRICFTAKNRDFFSTQVGDSPSVAYQPFLETSNGMQRIMFNQVGVGLANTNLAIETYLFRGVVGKDWADPLIAPLDNTRVDVKFDKTWTYRSGNQVGTVKELKLWHPMNKNLVYDDDESGANQTTSYTSVQDKRGMGDYYIYDIFSPGTGGTVNDLIAIVPSSSLYWHEK
uniref:Capsid protein n=1 Tax=Garrulus glandarius Genomoviridae sp. TaxID=2814974 RepID=A0A8A4XCY7_9VIRU|nr:MAG: capsid protein [Gemycircularvirus]